MDRYFCTVFLRNIIFFSTPVTVTKLGAMRSSVMVTESNHDGPGLIPLVLKLS
jgi:hypothetical protein